MRALRATAAAARAATLRAQLQLRCAAGGAAGGRHSRRPGRQAPPAPAKDLTATLTTRRASPPGLRRLALSEVELQAVLETGRCEGPSAGHHALVQTGALESDAAQAACASALQELWEALASYKLERARWKEQHAAWQQVHAGWAAKEAERQAAAAKAAEEGGEGQVASEPEPEPPQPPEPRLRTYGCYVWGSVGSGKSLLTDLFVDCCSGAGARLALGCRRVHFHEFMHEVHQELHQLRRAGAEKTTQAVARRIAEEVQLLAFDEFQITNISDALIVETLFDSLFQQGVAIVMTSNRPPEDLYKDGLNRHLAIPQFLALLTRQAVSAVELSAARDFRASMAVLPEGTTDGWRDFFHKAEVGGTEGAEERLQSAFADAAGVTSGTAVTVPVAWGRKLDVKEASCGVGRFSFQQLCGDALNADDYLHLTMRFHTLVVADVPRFSLEQHNEARRFTNLVDCLYERHARLILSADAPPDQLLETMTALASLSISDSQRSSGPGPGLAASGSSDWIRNNPFSPEPSKVEEVTRSAQSVGAGAVKAGDDDTATGAGVAGVMAGALGSLQESGFAARRATSRLLHMQTDDYLQAHHRNRAE